MTEVHPPSPQQQVVYDWVTDGDGNLFLQARAGTGKTSTLVGACGLMTGSIAFAAYNKKIATEIEAKLQEAGVRNNQMRTGTFHKFGLAAVRQVHRRTLIDARVKEDRIIGSLRIPSHLQGFSMRLCSLAKQSALGLFGSIDDDRRWWDIIEHHDLESDLEDPQHAGPGLEFARQALRLSGQIASEVIDFDDMIYLPVVNNYRVWQNDWILVDEAQDTNPARRALARKMMRPGGRAIFVGDDRQAIYGFTGADADAIQLITSEFGCQTLPLTVTYRCPKTVVAVAQKIVSDIEAHESAPEGEVTSLAMADLLTADLQSTDAILCRKTAPLVSTAFRLIKAGVACHVEGREIGQGLLKLARRWKIRSLTALRDRLGDYAEKEVAKLAAKGKETLAAAVQDRVDTLLVLMEGCDDLDCLYRKIETMFQDNTPTLTLSTVHKSKGREWERVFILGRHEFMPSPWARQAWQQVQEQNLIYVATTRSKNRLVHLTAGASA